MYVTIYSNVYIYITVHITTLSQMDPTCVFQAGNYELELPVTIDLGCSQLLITLFLVTFTRELQNSERMIQVNSIRLVEK